MDGSSIIDANFAVGSIFGVWPGSQLLGRTGREQVRAVCTAVVVLTRAAIGVYTFSRSFFLLAVGALLDRGTTRALSLGYHALLHWYVFIRTKAAAGELFSFGGVLWGGGGPFCPFWGAFGGLFVQWLGVTGASEWPLCFFAALSFRVLIHCYKLL